MKKFILAIFITVLFQPLLGNAQAPSTDKIKKAMEKGLEKKDFSMIEKACFVNSENYDKVLEQKIESEKEFALQMGEELTEEDLEHFNMSDEEKQEKLKEITSGAKKQFATVVWSIEQMGWGEREVVLSDLQVTQNSMDRSVRSITGQISFEDTTLALSMDYAMIIDNELFFTAPYFIRIEGLQATNVFVHNLTKALKTENPQLFTELCVPKFDDFKLLMEHTYADNPDMVKNIMTQESYDGFKKKISDNFNSLLEKGKENGVVWSEMKLVWSGNSSSLQGKVYQLKIPFEFISGDTQHRVEVDFCTQDKEEMHIIMPGEFVWKK